MSRSSSIVNMVSDAVIYQIMLQNYIISVKFQNILTEMI